MTKIRSRDDSRIQDRRGQGGGGGGRGLPGGLGIPLPGKVGGGMVGILLMLAAVFLPRLLGGGGATSGVGPAETSDTNPAGTCDSEIEQVLCGATDDVAEFWIRDFESQFGGDREYLDTETVFFSGFTNTGCGQASAETGPFYCPNDNLVYFDLDFLQTLQNQLGIEGDLGVQYIVAHEYGHHVQNVLGTNAQVQQAQQRDPERANQYSVALELQADCLAGVWANDAERRDRLQDGDIEEAIGAAEAVGDDRIQQQTQGRIEPENWTHGSSEQRASWFRRGFSSGDAGRCNTFDEVL